FAEDYEIPELRPHRSRQCREALAIEPPHFSYVPLDQTVLEELGNRTLEHWIALQVGERAIRDEALDQVLWRCDEPKPQPWSYDLRQRSDVDNEALGVDAGDRHQRVAGVVKLVVVVVFEDRELLLRRQPEELEATGGCQRDGRRVLVVRRHVH